MNTESYVSYHPNSQTTYQKIYFPKRNEFKIPRLFQIENKRNINFDNLNKNENEVQNNSVNDAEFITTKNSVYKRKKFFIKDIEKPRLSKSILFPNIPEKSMNNTFIEKNFKLMHCDESIHDIKYLWDQIEKKLGNKYDKNTENKYRLQEEKSTSKLRSEKLFKMKVEETFSKNSVPEISQENYKKSLSKDLIKIPKKIIYVGKCKNIDDENFYSHYLSCPNYSNGEEKSIKLELNCDDQNIFKNTQNIRCNNKIYEEKDNSQLRKKMKSEIKIVQIENVNISIINNNLNNLNKTKNVNFNRFQKELREEINIIPKSTLTKNLNKEILNLNSCQNYPKNNSTGYEAYYRNSKHRLNQKEILMIKSPYNNSSNTKIKQLPVSFKNENLGRK